MKLVFLTIGILLCCYFIIGAFIMIIVSLIERDNTKRVDDFNKIKNKNMAKNEIKIEYVNPKCFHPEHNPATMIVRKPGIYEHTCPSCGETQEIIVHDITI